jgi:hypothetical protein
MVFALLLGGEVEQLRLESGLLTGGAGRLSAESPFGFVQVLVELIHVEMPRALHRRGDLGERYRCGRLPG